LLVELRLPFGCLIRDVTDQTPETTIT